MDMSFAIQALCLEYLAKNGKGMCPGVYDVPEEIDNLVAWTKLHAMGLEIDKLTKEQEEYIKGF